MEYAGIDYRIDYEPAESTTRLFGGNSNWRGPVWFPINYLIIEALQKFHYFYGDDFKVEMPDRIGKAHDPVGRLDGALAPAHASSSRATPTAGARSSGRTNTFQRNPLWRDYIPFYEYFHGDNGAGLGASHQTGWTALVAKLIQQHGEYCSQGKHPFS